MLTKARAAAAQMGAGIACPPPAGRRVMPVVPRGHRTHHQEGKNGMRSLGRSALASAATFRRRSTGRVPRHGPTDGSSSPAPARPGPAGVALSSATGAAAQGGTASTAKAYVEQFYPLVVYQPAAGSCAAQPAGRTLLDLADLPDSRGDQRRHAVLQYAGWTFRPQPAILTVPPTSAGYSVVGVLDPRNGKHLTVRRALQLSARSPRRSGMR